ncbi:nucleoside triphosphate pyrophosphatase [Tychonema sp. LEGE 07203]|uniref:nucleoside triphosphate pyrophosphatase n=1 Tax=Tychonema sp. LEGE 07203 TaxID=1828671 RepID=UPI001882B94D|nr:nucleoside triphosphate pyrophosphatase [Tychonema sp. LEGE 07203]MBE9095930.1 septum formation inhibitor Maf [Tychonema sp. LEGE 07203]
MNIPTFVLASASPARRGLLKSAGIQAVICPSDFDEGQIQMKDATKLVQVLAEGKAEAVAKFLLANSHPQIPNPQSCLVLGCDSILLVDGEIHGKPQDAQEAISRWQQMRGKVGELYTGHALIDNRFDDFNEAMDRSIVRCQVTKVHFAEVTSRQIAAYVATGEPMQCAGCFALEGKGGFFVDKIEGCHTNVIGLSLPLLRQMLGEMRYDVADFWQS